MEGNIIPTASEYEKLLQEISALQAEIVRLTALRDDLVYRICPSLRAIYEEEIGSIEREILAAQLYLQEKKRILELLRAQLNRQEQMSFKKAAQQAEEEKKEYEEELKRRAKEAEEFRNRWQNNTNWSSYGYEGSGEDSGDAAGGSAAGSGTGGDADTGHSSGAGGASGTGSSDEAGQAGNNQGSSGDTDGAGGADGSGDTDGAGSTDGSGDTDGSGSTDGTGQSGDGSGEENLSIAQRIKRLYRKIVKRLHPDVRPDLSEHEKDLFQQAQTAYERGDLEMLERIWQELEGMDAPEETFTDTPEDIEKMKGILENLKKLIRELQREITSIRSEFPYTMRELLENEELLGEKKAALQKQLQEIREANDLLAETIEQLREKLNQ